MRRFERSLVVVCLSALFAVPLHAACTVSLTAPPQVQSDQKYDVVINSTGTAFNYVLTEEWSGRLFSNQLPRSTVKQLPAFQNVAGTYRHRTTFDLQVKYRVVATNTVNSNESCFAEATVTVLADPFLDRVTRRAVIPVVGSTHGLNDSQFKTSLKLTGNTSLHGRLVFHPIGKDGSDTDPSIPYDFDKGAELIFDDLMAAFGFTGVGSLDIVPDGPNLQSVPYAEARIYNQNAQGTFGMIEPMMFPAEWMGFERPAELKGQGTSLVVPPISEGVRVNLGVRSVSWTDISIFIQHADGTVHRQLRFGLAPDTLRMGTPSQLVAPYTLPDLVPGDIVTIQASPGAIPFYTVNDNKTSDPAISFPVLSNLYIGRYND